MAENYFGEGVAARYDESAADLFAPAVIDPVVDFLADLAGQASLSSSASAPAGLRYRSRSAGFACRASTSRRRWSQKLRAKPGARAIGVTIGDFATTTVEGA